MGRKGRRTKGMEEAHPFAGIPALHPQRGASVSRINPNAVGVDIEAVEVVVCVPGEGDTQIVRGFGNYTFGLTFCESACQDRAFVFFNHDGF